MSSKSITANSGFLLFPLKVPIYTRGGRFSRNLRCRLLRGTTAVDFAYSARQERCARYAARYNCQIDRNCLVTYPHDVGLTFRPQWYSRGTAY